MTTMTKEEFMRDYGDVLVKFISYYEYKFTFSGLLDDGRSIAVGVGGGANVIYKMPVNADAEMTVTSLDPFVGHVFDTDGTKVDSFYDI